MNLRFLFWAYTLIWILLGGYIGLLALRQLTLSRRLERLRTRLESARGAAKAETE